MACLQSGCQFLKVNVINVLMLSYLKYLVKSGLNGQNSCT
ncbi:hypothetical protein HMPREF9535_02042 [Escherichia coli MS 78-1]|nr:hypothetical protein HMPREF9548_03381 [Escherichia coli MS 182-1]EFK74001.1 hypothetical protein HMPREF9535_02042 [Escherichia coli MS 78-1]KDW20794.1 hypothetical protein AB86_1126 [Escherichia coli 2-177-06_S3_C1]